MKKIGIVVAMEEECEAIKKIMKNEEFREIYNLNFITGKISEKECVIVKSGVGKVNAARTTQVLIDYFKVEYIINLGAAGAINDDLDIGDILIGKYVVQHDFDITAFGHSKGYITGVGNNIECDNFLIEKFKEVINNIPERDYKIKLGIVATGDIFCTDVSMKDKIRAKFGADVVDMECAAIAQVAYLNNLPFVVVRSISDKPNGYNASTFDENLRLASKRCSNILIEFLKCYNL